MTEHPIEEMSSKVNQNCFKIANESNNRKKEREPQLSFEVNRIEESQVSSTFTLSEFDTLTIVFFPLQHSLTTSPSHSPSSSSTLNSCTCPFHIYIVPQLHPLQLHSILLDFHLVNLLLLSRQPVVSSTSSHETAISILSSSDGAVFLYSFIFRTNFNSFFRVYSIHLPKVSSLL